MLRVPAEAAKTRRERVVGLTPTALRVLNQALQAMGEWSKPLLAGDFRKRFKNARKAIGYEHTITLRDLRHCHATWSAQGTGDAAATQAALGHTDLRTTQRYLSATLARTASAASAVESALGAVADAASVTAGVTVNCHDDLSRSALTRPSTKDLAAARTTARSVLSASRGDRIRTCDPLLPKRVGVLLKHAERCEHCLLAIAQSVSIGVDADGCRHTPRHTAEYTQKDASVGEGAA